MAETSEIVKRLGGTEFLADRLKVQPKAIKMWEARGGVPESRMRDLLLLAKELRIRLRLEEIPSQRAA